MYLERSPFSVSEGEAEFVVLTTNARSTSWTFEAATPLCWWPHADLFQERQRYKAMPQPPGGSIELFGGEYFEGDGRGVLWIINAIYPCPPKEQWKSDCHAKRVDNFHKGLMKFGDLLRGGLEVTRIVVPEFTGCTQSHDPTTPPNAPDKKEKDLAAKRRDWAKIMKHLETFAEKTGVNVLITASLEACSKQAPYKRFPPRVPTADENRFRQSLLTLQAPAPLLTGGSWASHVNMRAMMQRSDADRERDKAATKKAMAENPFLSVLAASCTQQSKANDVRPQPPATSTARGKRDRPEEEDGETGDKMGSPYSHGSKRSRTSLDEPAEKPLKWTQETWYKAHITDVMTPEAIQRMRQLRQGDDAWVDCEAKQVCLTTSKFGACYSVMSGGSEKRLQEVGQQVIWRSRIPANKFMMWGTYHEDDGKGAFAAAAAFGLADRIPNTPFDRSTAPFIQVTNQKLMRWSNAAKRGTAPFDVQEVMDSRGVNVDVEEKVLAYSYDGMYRIQSALEGSKPSWVLIEVKCTSTMLTAPREDHMCQMLGMLGGLRKQGYPLDKCVYVNWQRHATRFWCMSFDDIMYKQMLRKMLWIWNKYLLPLFVARDNGILPQGRLEVPIAIDDIEDDVEV